MGQPIQLTAEQFEALLNRVAPAQAQGADGDLRQVEIRDKRIRANKFDGKYPGTLGFYLDNIKRIGTDQNLEDARIISEIPLLLDDKTAKLIQTLPQTSFADWNTFRTALVNAANPKALIGPKRTHLRGAKMDGQDRDVHTQEELNEWKEKVFGLTAATMITNTRKEVEDAAAEHFVEGLPPDIGYLVRCGLDEDVSWSKSISVAERVLHSHNQAVEGKKSVDADKMMKIKNGEGNRASRSEDRGKVEKDVEEMKDAITTMSQAISKLSISQNLQCNAIQSDWRQNDRRRVENQSYQNRSWKSPDRNQGQGFDRRQGSPYRRQYDSPNRRRYESPSGRYQSPNRGRYDSRQTPPRGSSPFRPPSPYRNNYSPNPYYGSMQPMTPYQNQYQPPNAYYQHQDQNAAGNQDFHNRPGQSRSPRSSWQ